MTPPVPSPSSRSNRLHQAPTSQNTSSEVPLSLRFTTPSQLAIDLGLHRLRTRIAHQAVPFSSSVQALNSEAEHTDTTLSLPVFPAVPHLSRPPPPLQHSSPIGMTPGMRARSRSQQVAPSEEPSIPASGSPNIRAGLNRTTCGRGASRNLSLSKCIRDYGGKLLVIYPEGALKPVGQYASKFVAELGIQSRKRKFIHAKSWGEVSLDDKEEVLKSLQDKFNITFTVKVLEGIEEHMVVLHKQWIHRLHMHFKKYPSLDEVIQYPHPQVAQDDWEKPCKELFTDEKYKKKSMTNTVNRSKREISGSLGSRSYINHRYMTFPTPIHKWNLPNLPNNIVVVKFGFGQREDLSGLQLSGNKARKLEFLLADVVAQEADDIVTIGGIQSNHCKSTAIAAKFLNLDCYLILFTSKAADKDPGITGNLLVERLVGAHIDLVLKEELEEIGFTVLTYLLKERLLSEGRKPYVIPPSYCSA